MEGHPRYGFGNPNADRAAGEKETGQGQGLYKESTRRYTPVGTSSDMSSGDFADTRRGTSEEREKARIENMRKLKQIVSGAD